MIHTFRSFSVVNETEIDVCVCVCVCLCVCLILLLLYDPMDIGHFIQWMSQNLASLIAVTEEFTGTLVFQGVLPLIYIFNLI